MVEHNLTHNRFSIRRPTQFTRKALMVTKLVTFNKTARKSQVHHGQVQVVCEITLQTWPLVSSSGPELHKVTKSPLSLCLWEGLLLCLWGKKCKWDDRVDESSSMLISTFGSVDQSFERERERERESEVSYWSAGSLLKKSVRERQIHYWRMRRMRRIWTNIGKRHELCQHSRPRRLH